MGHLANTNAADVAKTIAIVDGSEPVSEDVKVKVEKAEEPKKTRGKKGK